MKTLSTSICNYVRMHLRIPATPRPLFTTVLLRITHSLHRLVLVIRRRPRTVTAEIHRNDRCHGRC